MRGKAHASPLIKAILREKRAANAKFRRELRMAQACCPHGEVFEEEWKPSEYLMSLPSMRVCRQCGYYEFGRYGSYSDGTGWRATGRDHCGWEPTPGYKTVLTTQFAVKVGRGSASKYMIMEKA